MIDRIKVIKGLGEALQLLAQYVPGERYLGYAPGACLDAIELLKEDAIPVEWLKEKALNAGDPFNPFMMILFAWYKEKIEPKEGTNNAID